jgi:hypothetical protein
MVNRWSLRFALSGVLFFALVGCRSHPELSKTNAKNSSEWHRLEAVGTLSMYWIASANRIDTPGGEKIPGLDVSCASQYHTIEMDVTTGFLPETGAVKFGFGGRLSQKNWDIKTDQVRDRTIFTLMPPDTDQADLLRQLRQSKEFEFEFTPKGGKSQRSRFKLLNINTLIDQDQICKKASLPGN